MAAPSAEAPKTVPKRNDPKPSPLYRNSRATELLGEDPDFVYQTFSEDADSPAYIGKRLTQHERGEPNGYKVMVGPWEVCHSQTDAKVRSLDPRTDQGKPVDTVQRYGRQIRCRIHKEEFAKYALVEEANQGLREKAIFEPDRRGAMTALVMNGDRDETERMNALADAGHPMPGVPRRVNQ